jgi:acetylornithine aminotransferase
VIDEVQSGIGRTGQWFASLSDGVRPDVLTLAKGLGGGLPIGACIGFGAAGRTFAAGEHGSTFGGNPIACAAALAVLDTIADEHLLDAREAGGRVPRATAWPARPARDSGGARRRAVARGGAACARGGEPSKPAPGTAACSSTPSKPDVLRLAPPLILTEADVDEALPILA